MQIRGRYRPTRRGFGFLTPVADDGVTPAAAVVHDSDGRETRIDRVFVAPQQARALVADDLVEATVTLGDKGAAAAHVTVTERVRRLLVGTVQRRRDRELVIDLDGSLGTGGVGLDERVADSLRGAAGQQVAVLAGLGEGGAPSAQALVSGPHPAASPDAVRVRSVVTVLGGAAPTLIPGGPASVGLDPAAADTTHLRFMGQLASGRRGAAAGLDRRGPIPGAALAPVDRRAEPCVTVDAATSREIDDAVAARWNGDPAAPVHVAVHIADAAGAVGVGSPADRYARTVASTAYLVSGSSAPMLDPEISEGSRSLVAGQDRPALSVRFAVRADGSVAGAVVELAHVRSHARLSYRAVQRWLAGDAKALRLEARSHADAADAVVRNTLEAARRLGVERDARGTLETLFEDAELTPAVADGRVQLALAEPHAQAYRLIERVMVAANEAVGGWLVDQDVPALYRAHEGIDPDRWERLRAAADLAGASIPSLDAEHGDPDRVAGELLAEIDRLAGLGADRERDLLVAAAASSTARATYEPDPSRHRGLATAAYCHFTSPLRRYADLLVHRQIRAALADELPPHDVAELKALSTWLAARAGALARLEARERADLWSLLLQQGQLSGSEPATVTGVTAAGLQIRLPRLGLPGFIPAEQALGLPDDQRATLEVDRHGLTTASGTWRVGARTQVQFAGLDDLGRPRWEPVPR